MAVQVADESTELETDWETIAPDSLAALVNRAALRHGASLHQLERIARGQGFKVVHTTMASIRRGTYNATPSAKTLEALAFLADVSFDEANRAAGLDVIPGPSFAEQLPRHADRMTVRQREAVNAVIRQMLEAQTRIEELEQENKELRERGQ